MFISSLDTYFINYYDCKEIKKEVSSMSGGLKQLARDLGVERVGTMHQAGSDAYVTLEVYFKLRNKLKQAWCIDSHQKLEDKIKGNIYGIQDISFNEDQYIDQYKIEAKMIQYRDDTGLVNRRKLIYGQNSRNHSNGTQPTLSHGVGMLSGSVASGGNPSIMTRGQSFPDGDQMQGHIQPNQRLPMSKNQ